MSASAGAAVVAAAQFAPRPGEVPRNLAVVEELVRSAARDGAQLVVLPEFAISGYDHDWVRAGAPNGGTKIPGPVTDELAGLGARLKLAIVVNDLERAEDRLYSTSLVLVDGAIAGVHRKTTVTQKEELSGLSAGDHPAQPVTIAGLPFAIAPMICFEHGFPELALDLALAGTELVAISSLIGIGNEYLRNLRTRARAQDNGMYVVAANAAGEGYCGESMIVDPRGEVVARASASGTEVITAVAHADLIRQQRALEPVLDRRRPELWPRASGEALTAPEQKPGSGSRGE